MRLWLQILFCVCLANTNAAGNCYLPDGILESSQDYQPCNSVLGTISMCCGTNRTGIAAESCLPNGLCRKFGTEGGVTTEVLWRESCTDPTWQSPFCLRNICATADMVSECNFSTSKYGIGRIRYLVLYCEICYETG